MSLRICFFASDKAREHLLADAFLQGARRHGHATEVRALAEDVSVDGFDVGCMVGVKSRALLERVNRAGAGYLMFDKGYSRHKSRSPRAGWEYWRVAIDAHHPTARLAALSMPDDRLQAMGWEIKPWREPTEDGAIILAGSSAKYHEFYRLGHPTTYAKELVRQLRTITKRPLVYRPKPSWREATPILKTRFSQLPETLADLMADAHCLVTHGSNACFEAMLAGVPSIVLGEGVAKPLSSTEIGDVEGLHKASDALRRQWAANLAYFQWTGAEFSTGEAWDFLGQEIHRG